ncbi:hypothetical protein LTR36_005455 [Oleoguttula mirabilis]|uniref:ATPase synthesis protein 25 n=1 Tax=Oleoguttula mirabilis TaxID=1507867 RepID=A0AAV9JE49_9PEZI|nr:hypothetical protein LTR36_005455 [Oleoguttula mirabilis]
MALPTTALRTLGCHSCRQWALRTFIASIGGPCPMQPAPLQQRRALSRTVITRNEARERIQQDEHILNDINDIGHVGAGATAEQPLSPSPPPEHVDAEEQPQAQAPQEQEPTVPWYLRVRPQPTADQPSSSSASDSPLAARQRLPDLPTHPPPLLQPILDHISIHLGLDDLTLLDLRTLDPPPASGSNLLMLIGTARSEKHLHVSADRLCRWLRSDPHLLSPFADGLLGRNELKLKMRRKAKRSRLMAGVGAKATGEGEVDEGIRTGWVCVNVGRVEGGELPEQEAERRLRARDFVGFGTQTGGSRIVVQMLTEEKREEIGLERLWTGIVNRARKEREKVAGEDGEGKEEEESHVVAAGERVRQVLDPAAIETSEGGVQRGELGMAT